MTIILVLIKSAASIDCSPSFENIKCECTTTTAECFGSQTNIFEAEEILKNFSRTENVIFKIDDLQFDTDFMLEDPNIKNLTLGYTKYGLQVLSPKFFSRLSSNLISLNLQNNSINKIDDYFFSNFSLLTELFIDNNDIENLTSNTFTNLNNLKYLSISYNNISNIIPEVFQNLISLETVILSYNKFLLMENININSATIIELMIDNCLIEGFLDKNTLTNVPNVEKLDLSYNKLSGIESGSLTSLKNLKYLNLSYNVIERLEENAFSEIYNLTMLDLQGNKISVIKLTSFEKLQNLKYLDLSGNKLRAVLCEYTTDFTSLETIYLQNNEIKTFTPGAFFYSPKLKILDMTGNNLECSCPLTDSALYLIGNGTMERTDLESVSCIISSTGSVKSVLKYESSKCISVEPCKKIEVIEEDEYEDSISSSTTDLSTTLMSTTQSVLSETVTESTIPLISTTEYNAPDTTSTSTDSEESTTLMITTQFLNETMTDNTTIPLIITTEYNTSNTTSISTNSEQTTTLMITTQFLNETVTDNTTTPLIITTEYNTTNTTSISTDSEQTTILMPITQSVLNKTVTVSTMEPSTYATEYNVSNTISTDSEDSTVSFTKTTTGIYTESISDNSYEETNATYLASSDITTTATTVPITEKIVVSSTTVSSKTVSPDSELDCSSLQLPISNMNLSSDFEIFKNFSNERNIFCLKWTASGIRSLKIRCSIKYTTTAGTKVKHLPCPSSDYEIKDWTINEKVFRFCLILYPEGKRKQDSCELLVSEKSTTISTSAVLTTSTTLSDVSTTTNTITNVATSESTSTESFTPLDDITSDVVSTIPDNITTTFDKSTAETIFTSDKTGANTIFTMSTTGIVVIQPATFKIMRLNLYFNDSKLAFTTWAVNEWQPFSQCNLTLKVSTQYFDEIEGVFPCENNTYRLTKVKEDDIFKVCLFSYHIISGRTNLCQNTLPSAKASSGNESVNSSLIPLICLLLFVGLIILFIVIKNISKRRSVSKKYDVRAEEEKYQERAKLRPQSIHEESVRFSYIAKENHEYI